MPIRSLAERHRARIETHLLQLDERDRYLRFGYSAGDEQIREALGAVLCRCFANVRMLRAIKRYARGIAK